MEKKGKKAGIEKSIKKKRPTLPQTLRHYFPSRASPLFLSISLSSSPRSAAPAPPRRRRLCPTIAAPQPPTHVAKSANTPVKPSSSFSITNSRLPLLQHLSSLPERPIIDRTASHHRASVCPIAVVHLSPSPLRSSTAACRSHLCVARLVGHLGFVWVRANTKLLSQFLPFQGNSAVSLKKHAEIFLSFEARKGH